jgi:hypothetical protein
MGGREAGSKKRATKRSKVETERPRGETSTTRRGGRTPELASALQQRAIALASPPNSPAPVNSVAEVVEKAGKGRRRDLRECFARSGRFLLMSSSEYGLPSPLSASAGLDQYSKRGRGGERRTFNDEGEILSNLPLFRTNEAQGDGAVASERTDRHPTFTAVLSVAEGGGEVAC